jgi:catechol 2,3-dioxygenase-like lactoylglutathione lyase family enzyme
MSVPAILSLVTLGVADVPASTMFYESLGFPLSSASVPGEVSFFHTAGGLLGVFGVDALAEDATVSPGAAAEFRAVSLAINVASEAAVDDALTHAEACGAQIVKSARATDWGGYHGYFTDPDRHLWEVAHNPYWPLDERGLPQLP